MSKVKELKKLIANKEDLVYRITNARDGKLDNDLDVALLFVERIDGKMTQFAFLTSKLPDFSQLNELPHTPEHYSPGSADGILAEMITIVKERIKSGVDFVSPFRRVKPVDVQKLLSKSVPRINVGVFAISVYDTHNNYKVTIDKLHPNFHESDVYAEAVIRIASRALEL